MEGYTSIPPAAKLRPEKYHLKIPDQDVSDLRELLRLSKLAPKTYENVQTETNFGVTHEWMSKVKEYWLNQYDWYVHWCAGLGVLALKGLAFLTHHLQTRRKREEYINSYPHYTVDIEEDGESFQIHFVALFSKKPDAVPLLMMHGWPGRLRIPHGWDSSVFLTGR